MRNVIYRSTILAGVVLAPLVTGGNWSPAAAANNATHIENAPCGWFTSSYPGAWGTDHKVLINPGLVIERMSIGRGTYRLTDGTDAYDYLEKRCGKD